jgi:phosphoadenosine phosphosulfate reductase
MNNPAEQPNSTKANIEQDSNESTLVSLQGSSAPALPDGRVAEAGKPTDASVFQHDDASMAMISESSSPMELVAWGLKRFLDQRKIMTTSFGMEGCALIDMCSRSITENKLPNMQVAWIDTGFFFPETLQLKDKLAAKYPNIDFVKWETEVSVAQQAETYGNELWKNNPNLCCHIRKVVPMKENIGNFDLWITGLRRSQTKARAQTPIIAWDWRYQLLKFCPLATWTRPQVWEYIQQNEVPFNQLHLQSYPTISCFHCTQAVPGSTPDSDAREGRWEGKDKDECGLHFSI